MKIEIWSDVVCPWCYIGKRRLEHALTGFEHAGDVEITWRSFQLNPEFPRGEATPATEYLARRFGPQAPGMTARGLGATGVPFFVIDRKYGISGAQPAETFLRALRTAWAEDSSAPAHG